MNEKIIATKLHQMRVGILGVQNNPEIQAKMPPSLRIYARTYGRRV
jgi:hypothetical protein